MPLTISRKVSVEILRLGVRRRNLRTTLGWASREILKRQSLEHASRADGELDFAAARFHFFEGVREIREANLFSYKVVSEDIAAANGF